MTSRPAVIAVFYICRSVKLTADVLFYLGRWYLVPGSFLLKNTAVRVFNFPRLSSYTAAVTAVEYR